MSVCFAFMLSNLQYGVMNILILKILPCSEKLWLTDRCIDSSSVWLIHQFIVCRLSFWSTVFIQTVKCTKEKQKADTGQPILIRIYINTINTSICDKTTYRIINSIFFTDIDECTANSHDASWINRNLKLYDKNRQVFDMWVFIERYKLSTYCCK